MKGIVRAGFAATLALCVPAAWAADDIYRSTMRDGSVRYGEAPEYGAKHVKKIPAPPNSTGTIVVTEQEQGRQFTPRTGGSVTLAPPPRKRPEPHEQGRLQIGVKDLASRDY